MLAAKVLWPFPCGKSLLLLNDLNKTVTHPWVCFAKVLKSAHNTCKYLCILIASIILFIHAWLVWRCGGCMTRRHSNTTIDQFKSAWRKSPSLPPWVRAGWCGGRIQMFPSVAPHTAITLDYNSAHLLIRGVPSPRAVYWRPRSIVFCLFVFCATMPMYWRPRDTMNYTWTFFFKFLCMKLTTARNLPYENRPCTPCSLLCCSASAFAIPTTVTNLK